MAIYVLNVCNNVKGTVHRQTLYFITVCLHFAIIVHRLIIFLCLSNLCVHVHTRVCVCYMFLMHLILINASPCFVHAVQESQTVQRLR